jgi:hypothetical protein
VSGGSSTNGFIGRKSSSSENKSRESEMYPEKSF